MAYDAKKKPATHPGKLGEHVAGGTIGAAVGTVAGATAGAVIEGAALGAAAGPMGVVAGAGIGGVIGALAGKGIAQAINPTTEDAYWRDTYQTRRYVKEGESYDLYSPAYRYGVEAYSFYRGRPYDEIEPELSTKWYTARGNSTLDWDGARHAVRDAYERLFNLKSDNDNTSL